MTGRYGFIISSLYFIIFMTLPLTIFIIFSFIKFFFPIFHSFTFFTIFTVFTVFLATIGINIDISFNFSIDVNPVLLICIDWGKVNIHNVVISTTFTHDVLELFPFLFHIMVHVVAFTFSFLAWASVSTHWASITGHWLAGHWLTGHWLAGHSDSRVLVMGDWRGGDGGDENCRKFHLEINSPC